MKKRVSLLLVFAMLLSMLPMAAFAAESVTLVSVTDEAVTTTGYTYEYTAETAGTLNVTVGTCSPGWRYKIYSPDGSESIYRAKWNAGESCDYEGQAGNWKVVFYAYSSAEADNVAGTVSFDVTFTPTEGEVEVQKAEYEVSETALELGDNTLTLLDTAETTIYVFEPTETAVYTFTAPQGAILGYWGAGSWFLSNPNSTTNTYEWTCTGVGQSAYIGVSGVDGEFTLKVAKTGDYEVVETPIVKYENKATLETFTVPEGATLGGYVDVYGETHTAVLGEDGYYHLDSVDGDILLIDMDYMDIILSAALKSDRPVMYAYMYDENGKAEYKYDIGDAVLAYEEVMDGNGYYPVTEDILLFYQVYAVQAGTFTFHLTGDYNEDCVWMYCMRTIKLPETTEPSEPEETEPSEDPSEEPSVPESSEEPSVPESSEPEIEPSEPVAGVIIVDEAVTATSGSKYSKYYKATADGTLIVTVGDGSTNYHAEIATSPSLGKYEAQVSAEGSAKQTISLDVVANTQYYVRVWAVSGALAATPLTITFVEGGAAVEPSEPEDTEPSVPESSEPEKSAYEVSGTTLNVGNNTVAMLETAVTTIFEFEPAEAGTYTITGPDGSLVGNWGSNQYYLNDPAATTNSCQWTCSSVGQSVFVGVSGVEGTITVTVEKQEEPTEPEVTEPEVTEPETEPTVPSIPDEDVPAGTYYSITVDGNTTYYTSFNAATMNTNLKKITGTGYVKLYQDVSLGASISNAMSFTSGNVTLDLNGNTISFAYASVGALYVDGATLTVVDTSAEADGMVENTHASGYGIEVWNGTTYLKSGNIYGGSNAVRLYDSGDIFNMEGGTLAAQRYCVNAPAGSSATISGGTLTATLANQYAVFAASTATVAITGGYFNGTVSGSGLKSGISGGYFIKTVTSSYLADGCEVQDNDDAIYIYKVVDPNAPVEPSEPETEPTEPSVPESSEPETEPTEPSVPESSEPETEPTTPSEPEPSEPVEGGTLLTVENETVTATGYVFEYTAATAGTLTVVPGTCTPGYRYKVYGPGYESIPFTKWSSSHDHEITAGDWKIEFYAYNSSAADNVAGTVSFDVIFTPKESGGEVVKEEYQVSDTALALGDNTLTLLDTAVTTIYVFEPTETAVYTFTAPQGAILGYWGAGSWFLSNPNSTTNTYEWTCTGVGQSAYIGVSGVDGEFTLNVAKTGDYEVVETPIVKYENKATLETFTLPEGATLGGYVDVYGETHTAVLGEDGYYHLDSVDGDILLIDMDYMDIILSAALQSDRPVMYAYMYDEDGNVTLKYDIGDAVKAYEAVMDENGYYPVTEDILLFYQVYAVQAGTFTFYVTGDYNEDCVWMYCMRTVTLPEPAVNVAQVGDTLYTSVTEAAAAANGNVVTLLASTDEAITINADVTIDLAGYSLSNVTVADGYTLRLIDSATDDYEGAYGTAQVSGTVAGLVTANGKNYLVVSQDGQYSAHCYAVEITHVSLKPGADALGYKAQILGDEVVLAAVTGYGFKMSAAGGTTKTYTKDVADNFDGTFTLRLQKIMASNGGTMQINAEAFVIFGDTTETSEKQTTTMKDTILAVNEMDLSAEQKAAVYELYAKYSTVMDAWFEGKTNNIKSWAPAEA